MTEHKNPSAKQLLKGNDVAQILNISRSKAYQLMQLGIIPTVRIGHSVRVQYESLMQFIEKNTISQDMSI